MGLTGLVLQNPWSIEFDAEFLRQPLDILGRIQSDREHDQIEFLFLDPLIEGGVPDGDVLALRDLPAHRHVAADEPDVRQILRTLVEAFEILAVGPDVVMEDRRIEAGVMVFGQDHLLLGIGAADGRTVAVAPLD